jgi:hypothetical protein
LSYQGLEEENLDQKSPGPPGWGLMQRASSSLITKKQKMLKKTKHQASDRHFCILEKRKLSDQDEVCLPNFCSDLCLVNALFITFTKPMCVVLSYQLVLHVKYV